MKNNVHLKIVGVQSGGDLTEKQTVETETDAFLKELDDKKTVYYEETNEGVKTISFFRYGERSAEHTKKGEVTTTMIFAAGEKTKAGYMTPFGLFDIEVDTLSYSVDEKENEATIEILYNMTINDSAMMKCMTKVNWSKLPE